MSQKQVKIIGLTVKEQLGILQSCEIEFDKSNKLIPIKGEVGSGKTTLQRGLQLATLGSDTLKDDKKLYGNIDEEVQLLDGDLKIFVGCKSDKDGKLNYIIYTKDEEGKVKKNPVIDGVKASPSKYLESLQTALTWRMEELTSENATIQKKILLDLYKDDLSKVGVIYDKMHPDYVGSILDKIEKAEANRSQRDYARKEAGGFAKHLLEKGYDVSKTESLPKFIDTDEMVKQKNILKFQIDNSSTGFEEKKSAKLQEIINKSNACTNILIGENVAIQTENNDRKQKNTDLKTVR